MSIVLSVVLSIVLSIALSIVLSVVLSIILSPTPSAIGGAADVSQDLPMRNSRKSCDYEKQMCPHPLEPTPLVKKYTRTTNSVVVIQI